MSERQPLGSLWWLAVLSAPGMWFVWYVISLIAVPHAAVHLCRWPATISCEEGVTWLWVGLVLLLTIIVAVGTFDVLVLRPHDRLGTVRGLGYLVWTVVTVVAAVAMAMDREVGVGDLMGGTGLVLGGLALVHWTIRAAPCISWSLRRSFSRAIVALGILSVAAVTLAPRLFAEAWQARFG